MTATSAPVLAEQERQSRERQIGVQRWECDGHFGVSFDEDSPGCAIVRRGVYFGSDEAREYYILLELSKRDQRRAESELKCVYDHLSEISTLHGAWRNLLQALRNKFKG